MPINYNELQELSVEQIKQRMHEEVDSIDLRYQMLTSINVATLAAYGAELNRRANLTVNVRLVDADGDTFVVTAPACGTVDYLDKEYPMYSVVGFV